MDNLNTYYMEYVGATTDIGTTTTGVYDDDNLQCLRSFPSYPYTTMNYYPETYENKTEQAYKLVKKLIGEKGIPEPGTYKKFCSLLEKIRDIL